MWINNKIVHGNCLIATYFGSTKTHFRLGGMKYGITQHGTQKNPQSRPKQNRKLITLEQTWDLDIYLNKLLQERWDYQIQTWSFYYQDKGD